MTSKNDLAWGVAWSAVRTTALAAAALCLMQCSAEQSTTGDESEELGSVQSAVVTPRCGGLACTGTPTCTSAGNVPLCAETVTAKCHSAINECVWKIKTDPNCPCMERDVRHCNINPTTGGVQICVANAGRTATYWDTCQATPVCVP